MFIKTIPQGHCLVVERFGKPVRIAHSGLRFFIPILDKAKNVKPIWDDEMNKNGVFIELTEQQWDTKPQNCFTAFRLMRRYPVRTDAVLKPFDH